MCALSRQGLLLDTTVLVDVLRGNEGALDYVKTGPSQIAVSALTVAEIYAGARTGDALTIGRLLGMFRVIDVSSVVAQLGGAYRQQYGPSHGCSLIDCLIGATAELHDCRLATPNGRHFPMLSEVVKPY